MKPDLRVGFVLRCFQHLSPAQRGYPAMPKNWTTGTPEVGPFGSSRTTKDALQVSTPAADRVQPVLRRFEPSSRTLFIGEQPNPWDLLQPQDRTSRHRCRINLPVPRKRRLCLHLTNAVGSISVAFFLRESQPFARIVVSLLSCEPPLSGQSLRAPL